MLLKKTCSTGEPVAATVQWGQREERTKLLFNNGSI
jgi:hypothetical protein